MIHSIYVDGGVIGKNPSYKGGTWCWCHVNPEGERVNWKCGIITPDDLGLTVISNNITELMAAIRGLESVPKSWEGTIYTDSSCTLSRLTKSNSFKGLPQWMIRRTVELRRNRKWDIKLVAGHPNPEELTQGFLLNRKNTKRYVSEHNVFCDEQCTRIGSLYAQRLVENKKKKKT